MRQLTLQRNGQRVSNRTQGNSVDLKKHNRKSMHSGNPTQPKPIKLHWITLKLVLQLYGKSMRVTRNPLMVLEQVLRILQKSLRRLNRNCVVICIGLPQVHCLVQPLLFQRKHSTPLLSSTKKCITWQRLCHCVKVNHPKLLQNTKRSNEHSLTQQVHTVNL